MRGYHKFGHAGYSSSSYNLINVILVIVVAICTSGTTFHSHYGVDSFVPTISTTSSAISTGSIIPTATDELLQSIQELDTSALVFLNSGKVYKTLQQQKGYVEAMVVQDVTETPDKIWRVLTDFNKYSVRIPIVTLSEVYAKEAPQQQQQQPTSRRRRQVVPTTAAEDENLWSYYTHFKVNFFYWISLEFYIRYTLVGRNNTSKTSSSPRIITWTLDPNRTKENATDKTEMIVKDCTGMWYIIPHPTKPGWSRVYYSTRVQFQEWVPPLLIRLWRNRALSMASLWIQNYFTRNKEQGEEDSKLPSSSTTECNALNGLNTRSSSGNSYISTACLWSETTTTTTEQQPIGLLRYILVGMVFLLTLANLYLFLERMVT